MVSLLQLLNNINQDKHCQGSTLFQQEMILYDNGGIPLDGVTFGVLDCEPYRITGCRRSYVDFVLDEKFLTFFFFVIPIPLSMTN